MCYVRKTNLGKAFDGNVALLRFHSVRWMLYLACVLKTVIEGVRY